MWREALDPARSQGIAGVIELRAGYTEWPCRCGVPFSHRSLSDNDSRSQRLTFGAPPKELRH